MRGIRGMQTARGTRGLRVGRPAAAVAGGLALAVIAAGCAAQSPTPTATVPGTVATPTPQVTTKPSSQPEPAAAKAIAKTSLPSAASIGAGFRAHAEDADGDAQADTNGAGIDQRSPQDVADGLVPLGCPGVEAGQLPLPAHAWQQTYRSPDGRTAVALVLDYPSTAKATDLVSTLGSMLAKCVAPASLRGLTTPQTVATLATRSSDLVQDPGARSARMPPARPGTNRSCVPATGSGWSLSSAVPGRPVPTRPP